MIRLSICPSVRTSALAATLALTVAALSAPAQENRLPDIGSSADELLGPVKQAEYGSMMLSQLRYYDYTIDDPLIDGWLQTVGSRLAASSDKPDQSFTFFMLKDRQFNAFATLGGYIGTNAGLVLAAESEDEVASVLAHEVSHVTQSHVLRSVERAQKDSVPILLAMLGAIAIAQSSDGNSSDDASMAVLASAQALAAQRQIDYTRDNEAEADRVGIRTLARSGYDPKAMVSMFTRMQTISRVNQGGERERTPDYLRSHPVTTLRISDVKQRVDSVKRETSQFDAGRDSTSDNPLIPSHLRVDGAMQARDGLEFGWARERIRVISANTPEAAIREYERERNRGTLNDAQRYGLAVARIQHGLYSAAIKELEPLLARHSGDPWLVLAMAEAEARSGKTEAADARLEAQLQRMPDHRPTALGFAQLLAERNTSAAGQRAQAVLRPLLNRAKADPVFQKTFARVSEVAGDRIRAGEAYAEAEYLNGRPERALVQLNTLLKREGVDYYARARIEARIAVITPTVLELRRQGVRDDELRRR